MGQKEILKINKDRVEWKLQFNISKFVDKTQAMLRRKLISLNACIRKEKSQIHNHNSHLKKLEKKEDYLEPKSSQKKDKRKSKTQWNWKHKNSRENWWKNSCFFKKSIKLTNLNFVIK